MRGRRAALVADVSAEIGAGHVARCATLARALNARGWSCTLVTRRGAPASLTEGLSVLELDAAALTGAGGLGAAVGDVDCAIIDNYAASAALETACRAWARRVVAIDDAPSREHDCDLLLDQNAGRSAEDYAGLTPPAARILAGVRYALIGDPFRRRREASLARRRAGSSARRVLLSFGATDPANVTARAVSEVLAEPWAEQVTVLLSEAAPHQASVEAVVAGSGGRAELLLGASAEGVADALAEADIALGAGGTSAWERCCLGLPSVVVVVADNQRDIASALGARGAAIDLGVLENVPSGGFGRAARDLADDAERRQAMMEAAVALCDGAGAGRVAEAIEQACDADRI